MRMFSEMASSFYSTVSLVTEKLTNFKAAIYIDMKSLYTFTAAPSNKQINLVSTSKCKFNSLSYLPQNSFSKIECIAHIYSVAP